MPAAATARSCGQVQCEYTYINFNSCSALLQAVNESCLKPTSRVKFWQGIISSDSSQRTDLCFRCAAHSIVMLMHFEQWNQARVCVCCDGIDTDLYRSYPILSIPCVCSASCLNICMLAAVACASSSRLCSRAVAARRKWLRAMEVCL